MNTEAVIGWAGYIVLNKRNFIPKEFGRIDPLVVAILDKLDQALKEPPADIELPAERLAILEE